jgi:hypothetical protein
MLTELSLIEELIAEAMAKADARVCVGSDRCYPFPHPLEHARETCTPKGRCKVGGTRRVIVSKGGRERWNGWLEVSTGLVKLIREATAWGDAGWLVPLVAVDDQGRLRARTSGAWIVPTLLDLYLVTRLW